MEKIRSFQTDPALPLMARVEQALDYYQYAQGTAQSYCRWIKQYIDYLRRKKVPQARFQKEISTFLDVLVAEKNLSRASQKQALNAIVFLYKRVFDVEISTKIEPAKCKEDKAFPVVMTKDEVKWVFSHLKGTHLLMAGLIYGAGLRLMECVRLRVGNLAFAEKKIHICPEKAGKKRELMMPERIHDALLEQVELVRQIHDDDLRQGWGKMVLSHPQKRRYAGQEGDLDLQHVFPAKKTTTDPKTGAVYRPCVLASGIQKAVKRAAAKAGIEKKVSCNTLRHSFAVHLLENHVDIFKVKELMGHGDIKTTRMYAELMEKKDDRILSPLDSL